MKKIPREYYLELAVWLSHYHSGQWSRGYRLLSKLMFPPWNASWTSNFEKEAEESEVYQHLTANYANKV
jgi:hypothetical protein